MPMQNQFARGFWLSLGAALFLLIGLWPGAVAADKPQANELNGQEGQEETQPQTPVQAEEEPGEDNRFPEGTPQEFVALYDGLMNSRLDELETLYKSAARTRARLAPQLRMQMNSLGKLRRELSPSWWPSVMSTAQTKFKATMWHKAFVAEYWPSEFLGLQAPVGIENNRLRIVVTWRPEMVNDDTPLKGWLAKEHGLRRKDLAETIVWHELGHNYVSLCLPLHESMELFTKHQSLYVHVQETYADLTALRHASPKAARLAMMFRLRELVHYDANEPHTRAAYAIGALLLREFMTKPDNWPSIHFPPMVPKTDPELNTVRYVYEHMDVEWSLKEYMQLRSFVERWIRTRGDKVLRHKGKVYLQNGDIFYLMNPADRQEKIKRDKWIAAKLEALIKSGRADPMPPADQKPDKDMVREITINGKTHRIMNPEKRPGPLIYLKGETLPDVWTGIEIPM